MNVMNCILCTQPFRFWQRPVVRQPTAPMHKSCDRQRRRYLRKQTRAESRAQKANGTIPHGQNGTE